MGRILRSSFQGMDRLMLYDDSFADNAHVYLINAPNVSKTKPLNHVVADYFQKYGNNTKWMTIADTDEFIHSQYYGTIKNLRKVASKRS